MYDEIEIEDMTWDAEKTTFFYPCPCGDKFFITLVGVSRGTRPLSSLSLPFPLSLDDTATLRFPHPPSAGGPTRRRGHREVSVVLPAHPCHLRRGGAGQVHGRGGQVMGMHSCEGGGGATTGRLARPRTRMDRADALEGQCSRWEVFWWCEVAGCCMSAEAGARNFDRTTFVSCTL